MEQSNDNILLKSIKGTFKLTFYICKQIIKLIYELLKLLVLTFGKLIKLGCLYLINKYKQI